MVAPMKVSRPCSTYGRKASCCALLKRCTSSTNRMVRAARLRASAAACSHRLADVLDAGEHGRERDELGVEGVGHQARQRGLADARRPPQDHRMRRAATRRPGAAACPAPSRCAGRSPRRACAAAAARPAARARAAAVASAGAGSRRTAACAPACSRTARSRRRPAAARSGSARRQRGLASNWLNCSSERWPKLSSDLHRRQLACRESRCASLEAPSFALAAWPRPIRGRPSRRLSLELEVLLQRCRRPAAPPAWRRAPAPSLRDADLVQVGVVDPDLLRRRPTISCS